MRLYLRSKQVDLSDTIAHCDFDADHGHVKLALDRLRDLEEEVGADAKISYAEGLLHRDFLGQGLQAHQCFVRALDLNPTHALAACNATHSAPTEAEFRRWAELAIQVSPSDAPMLRTLMQQLGQEGASYQAYLLQRSASRFEKGKHGSSAAYLELVLQAGMLEENQKSQIRRRRAQYLRKLDREAAQLRETAGERFPSEERLSLQAAVDELDRAIAQDEYDAELWNLRSAWCILLERSEDAITAANNAIRLRPAGYSKPYLNKATALLKLDRYEEGLAMAKRAKEEATGETSSEDIRLAEIVLSVIQQGPVACTEDTALQVAQKIILGTEVRTQQFAGLIQGTANDLDRMFKIRLGAAKTGSSLDHVAPVAQLLAYCPVEAAATVLRNLRRTNPSAWTCSFEAGLYIVAKGEPVMQRDASRLVLLLILDQPTVEQMRRTLRENILAPSAGNPSDFGALAENIGAEMLRLNSDFPELLLKQAPPTEQELNKARAGVLNRLSGTPLINDSSNFPQAVHGGCAGLVVMGFVIAGIMGALALWA